MNYPIEQICADFPILAEKIRNKPLVYLDNAATCQKPQAVIDSIVKCYSRVGWVDLSTQQYMETLKK